MMESAALSLNTEIRSPSRIVPPFCSTSCSGIEITTGCVVVLLNSCEFASSHSHTSLRLASFSLSPYLA